MASTSIRPDRGGGRSPARAAADAEVSQWDQDYEDAKTARADIVSDFPKWDDYWEGRQWSGSYPSWQHTPVLNITLNAVENYVANLTANRPKIQYRSRTTNSRELMDSLSILADYAWDLNDFTQLWKMQERRRTKLGTCVYQIVWDPRAAGGRGDVRIRDVPLPMFYPSPDIVSPVQLEFQEGDWVITARPVTEQQLLANPYFGERAKAAVAAGRELAPQIGRFSDEEPFTKHNTAKSGAGRVLLKARWFRVFDSDRRRFSVHLAYWANGVKLWDSREDEDFRETGMYRHGLFPFVVAPFIPREHSLWGKGLPEQIASVQDFINGLLGLAWDSAALTAAPQKEIVVGAVEDIKSITNEPGIAIPVEAAGSIRNLEGPEIPVYVQNLINFLFGAWRTVTGVHTVMEGQSPQVIESGRAIESVLSQNLTRVADVASWGLQAVERVFEQVAMLQVEHYAEPRVASRRLPGGEMAEVIVDLRRLLEQKVADEAAGGAEDIVIEPEFSAHIELAPTMPQSEQFYLGITKELIAQGGPALAPALIPILLEQIHYPYKKEVIKAMSSSQAQTEEQPADPLAEALAGALTGGGGGGTAS